MLLLIYFKFSKFILFIILFNCNVYAREMLSLHKSLNTLKNFTNSSNKTKSLRIAQINRRKTSLPVFNFKEFNNLTSEEVKANEGVEEQQVLTALPDLSDPCFRRYTNSIIVNAQPYERRSSISLVNCKIQCLRSQVGHYTCRSFVYDNINQVCDLFAHVGDQAPARLLRFQTRDYFEPTAAIHCYSLSAISLTGTSFEQKQIQVPAATMPLNLFEFDKIEQSTPFNWPITDTPIKLSSNKSTINTTINNSSKLLNEKKTRNNKFEKNEEGQQMLLELLKSDKKEEERENFKNNNVGRCQSNQVTHFLRSNGFELFGEDNQRMTLPNEQSCIELCSQQENCKSLEYTIATGECVLSAEIAVPLGNGQLKQKIGTDYLERICVDKLLLNEECHQNSIYKRFPQMILVGFAETVVDSPTLLKCLDNCLKSQHLYGFLCSSGMFYFEEPRLNCILNTQDRKTQPELFTTETSDLVDYFETDCSGLSSQKPSTITIKSENITNKNENDLEDYENREFNSEDDEIITEEQENDKIRRKDFIERKAASDKTSLGWTQWTECKASKNNQLTSIGVQSRWKVCTDNKVCGREEKQCLLTFKNSKKINNSKNNLKIGQKTMATIFPLNKTKINEKRRKNLNLKQQLPSKRGEGISSIIDPKNDKIKQKSRFCTSQECCPLLGSCHLGIQFRENGKSANWCKNPCI